MDFRLTHIPFGLSSSNGSIVDVHSVSRGKDCNCVCPSCRTPLIARQGKENVWHFAHASRHVDDILKLKFLTSIQPYHNISNHKYVAILVNLIDKIPSPAMTKRG